MRDRRSLVELAAAVAAGVLLYNVHPTRLGNALVAHQSLRTGQTEGMSVEGRIALYAAMAVVGAMVLVASLLLRSSATDAAVAPMGRAAFALTLAGIAGLALDYGDGPQAWLHLAVFITLALFVLRVGRMLMVESTARSAPALR